MAQPAIAEPTSDVEYNIISRRKWKAVKTGTPPGQRLKHPINFVRFVETTTDADAYEDCSEYMREVQKFHMNFTSTSDITYNFVIGSDNVIYEGVGWNMEVDRPTKLTYLKKTCLDIGFVGDMDDGFMPTFEMLSKAIDVIEYGVKNKYISPTFKLIAIDNWRPTFWRPKEYF